MLENPENPFLKFNFLVTLMFHVGPYGEHFKKCPNVEYSKGQKAPSWKEHHIKARFSWAKKHVLFGEKWSDVVFTDEKNGI